MIGRLRVAVPRALLEHDAVGLDGRMWRQTLAELDRKVRLRAAEDRSRADVWLSSSLVDPAALGQPLVVQIHEAPWDDPLMAPACAELMAERTESAVQAAARVLTASRHGARQIRDRHAPRAIDVVPLGVDHSVFRPRGAARARTVLFVGAAHPRKNLGALREAAARIGVPLELVLSPAADREDSEALLAAAADGAVVHRRMDDEDLAALMDRSGVLCIPSLSEGFGLPALEAMACGTPVVASARGPLPEVVGDGGLLVEPTPDGLAAGLAQALDDHALGARGLQRASEFTWARTAAGWLAALEAARDAA